MGFVTLTNDKTKTHRLGNWVKLEVSDIRTTFLHNPLRLVYKINVSTIIRITCPRITWTVVWKNHWVRPLESESLTVEPTSCLCNKFCQWFWGHSHLTSSLTPAPPHDLWLIKHACVLNCSVWLFATPWTVAHQAPLSMEFSRQENWSGLPFSSPGNLPNPGIEPASLVSPELQEDSSPAEPSGKPSIYETGPISRINLKHFCHLLCTPLQGKN